MKTGNIATVTGTLDNSDAVECGFDADGTAHLMGVLSNMYRDKSRAVLREYAANARDSHIQAGKDKDPIEVTLPTEWEPTLTVADQGIGLGTDQLVQIYSRYGKSTKRDTNDQTGAFGIGSKSAFTIASQFTVVGIKDGEKTEARFALNAAGVGTVKIVSVTKTDEPNGVAVEVPVDDPAAMRRAARDLFSTWPPGTVLVDGEAPEYLPAAMLEINENLFARRRVSRSADEPVGVTVVMGGIPYPASTAMLENALRRCPDSRTARQVVDSLTQQNAMLYLLAIAPVGSVDITPSREDLRDTKKTIAMLAQIITDYASQLQSAIDRALSVAPTPMHASARLTTIGGFLSTLDNGVTWRGQWLSSRVILPYSEITLVTAGRAYRTHYEDATEFRLGQMTDGSLVITGADDAAVRTIRRLANRFMTHKGLRRLTLVPDTAASGSYGWWSYGGKSPLKSLSFAEFKVQASALPTVSERRQPRYDVFSNGSKRTMSTSQIREARAAGRRLFLSTRHYFDQQTREFVAGALNPDDMLVFLTGTQTADAFHRRFKDVPEVDGVLRDHARRTLDAATEQERLALEFVQDSRFERLTLATDLHTFEPIRLIVGEYRRRHSAQRSVGDQRFAYLRAAQRELRIAPDRTKPSTGLPLLDLLMDNISAFREIDTTTREHLGLYIAAVQEHQADSAPVHAVAA